MASSFGFRRAAAVGLAAALVLVSRPAAAGVRLGDDVVPAFEAVRLRLDADRPEYSGSVAIDLEVRRATDAFRFHALGQTLSRLDLYDGVDKVPLTWESGEGGVVTVRAGRPLAPGPLRLEIDFTQPFNTRAVGLYRMEHEGRGYAFTQLEAADARRAFPCWDEPGFKIPFQVALELPAAHLGVSNTPAESETVADGRRTIVFARTPPLPSYLIAIATGPLEFTPIPGLSVPGRVVTVAGQKHLAGLAVELTPAILAALERYFDGPYPFAKLDLVAVPEFWPGAMENPGAVTFAASLLLADPRAASLEQRRALASVTAHELAHMWFGDLVTMAWWDDLWLNESFADWMADKITAEVHPELGTGLAELESVERVMEEDSRPSTEAIRKPVADAEGALHGVGLAYAKGKAVLGMFERWLGAEAFRRGVNDYLRAHRWGNAVAADLWTALGRASGREVGAAMATFLDQPGLPRIEVTPRPEGGIRLVQRRFLNQGVEAPPLAWRIPVGLEYSDGRTVKTAEVLLDRPDQVALADAGPLAWVFPDRGAAGYYRWTLPPEMLGRLAEGAGSTLDAPERIRYLGNLSALLDAGMIHGDAYLEALAGFGGDPEPQVTAALLAGLERVERAFVPEPLTGPFAAYVRRVLGPARDRIGLEPKPGEPEAVALLRPKLLGWLGDQGRDEAARRYAEAVARRYLADPGAADPALAEAGLRLAAQRGDRPFFDDLRRRFEAARAPAERRLFLATLAQVRDPALQEEVLRYALSGPLRPNEIFAIPAGLHTREAGADRVVDWVRRNYETIAARVPPALLSFLPLVAEGCSAERLRQATELFSRPDHAVPGTAEQLAQVADQVTDCVKLREREGEAVARYLERGAGAGR